MKIVFYFHKKILRKQFNVSLQKLKERKIKYWIYKIYRQNNVSTNASLKFCNLNSSANFKVEKSI